MIGDFQRNKLGINFFLLNFHSKKIPFFSADSETPKRISYLFFENLYIKLVFKVFKHMVG